MNKLNLSLLVFTLILWGAYSSLNVAHFPLHSSKLEVDNFIPFISSFIIIYMSFFILIPLTLFLLFRKSSQGFTRRILIIFILTLIYSYIIYFFFQTYADRPSILSQGLFNYWVSLLYLKDAPFSSFPSIHASLSTIASIVWLREKWKLYPWVIAWALLIILSTVLIKQHYLADILGGATLALVISYLCLK